MACFQAVAALSSELLEVDLVTVDDDVHPMRATIVKTTAIRFRGFEHMVTGSVSSVQLGEFDGLLLE